MTPKQINDQIKRFCPLCEGMRKIEDRKTGAVKTCPRCNGTGKR